MSVRYSSFPVSPLAERLESRLQFSGNLAITSVSLVNSSDVALSTITPGEQIYIQATYTATGLASNANYRVDFTMNGVTRSTTYTTYGAGASGTSNGYFYWGTFVASPGVNQVTATIDPDNLVAETNEADNTFNNTFTATGANSGSLSYSVSQIRAAYGLNNLSNFGSSAADGTGQTVAIIDAYNDPSILTDLDGFDKAMHLSSNSSPTLLNQYGSASSDVTVYNQSGTNITANIGSSGSNGVPIVDPAGGWAGEETLDVEWVHAIAPGAHIDIIETDGTSAFLGLYTGAAEARNIPGVTVVSMSWIWSEANWTTATGETSYDTSTFNTPSGHTGITWLASSGDGGTPGGSPSMSPNVVAVGGSELSVSNNAYGSETGWGFGALSRYDVYAGAAGTFSQTGTWITQPNGFTGTQGYAPQNSNSTTSWTSQILSADQGWLGGTEVSATWQANNSTATVAAYKIYDGTSSAGTLLGTVNVNQTFQPNGVLYYGHEFQELGVFYPTSGHLTVVLSTVGSNGNVSADAVGYAPSWASGGGQSKYEAEPLYQETVQLTNQRTIPDVSFDGSINTGVTCYQNGIGYDYFGTSLSAPCWAGIMAIVDQGRVAAGGSVLNTSVNPQQAVQGLYSIPSTDFHDITTGYNGLFAAAGYDEVTGRGTPLADKVIPDLVNFQLFPAVVSSVYNYNLEPPTLTLTFNEDVSASLSASDLVLKNTTTGQTIPSSAYTVSFQATGNYFNPYPYLATFTFTGYTNSALPDGKYTATIAAANVTDTNGHPMSAASTTNFFALGGDFNHDGTVNIADLGTLASNYGASYVLFATSGDANYDHKVDIADLGILATNYGKTLPAVFSTEAATRGTVQTESISPASYSSPAPTPTERKKQLANSTFLSDLLA